MSNEPFMTVKQIADILKVSEKTVRNMLNNEEIKGFKVGREWRITPENFEKYLNKQ
ncbi:hypothetical protein CHH95_21905 [Bacillus licheniformis]|uniref:helix-turn-helix domain-containing protein n=1 Tax=Bacillus licheniformis TaxID=1402 RepID=UPI000BA637A7|nr:helix-turn-helix domain-containing protein [Bacillus licheniformis]PAE45731.1 hypothetical protein CHH95_21905 [Bacillus licheniformis]